jgi:hypothetical protein
VIGRERREHDSDSDSEMERLEDLHDTMKMWKGLANPNRLTWC